MRRLIPSLLIVCVSLGMATQASADEETQALIEKAIKAHGELFQPQWHKPASGGSNVLPLR
jgi:hypothetical protein